VRRGSITTSRPPRARIALALPRKSGTVHRLPLLTIGLAPITSSQSQRSMSGTGTLSQWPNISPLDSCLGIWSSVEAENTFFVPSALARRPKYSSRPKLVRRPGCPRLTGHRVAPVGLQDGRQAALDLGKGLVPARFDEAAVAADQRRAQAVGVFVQVLQREPLGQT
jgi:hypothetical protein